MLTEHRLHHRRLLLDVSDGKHLAAKLQIVQYGLGAFLVLPIDILLVSVQLEDFLVLLVRIVRLRLRGLLD